MRARRGELDAHSWLAFRLVGYGVVQAAMRRVRMMDVGLHVGQCSHDERQHVHLHIAIVG